MEWEKIFANDATDKRLIPKIYKQLIQINSEKRKQQNCVSHEVHKENTDNENKYNF